MSTIKTYLVQLLGIRNPELISSEARRVRRDRQQAAQARAEERVTNAHLPGVREYLSIWPDLEDAILRYAEHMGIRGYRLEMLRVRAYCDLAPEKAAVELPSLSIPCAEEV